MGIKTSLNIKIIPMKNIFCQIYITEINDYVNESVKNKDMKNIFCQIYITEINDYVNESVKNKDMTSRISKS